MFRSFEEGAEAFRALEQGGVIPDVARLSDEDETRLSLSLAGRRLARRSALGRALHRRARLLRRAAWRSSASRATAGRRRGAGRSARGDPASAAAGCRSATAPGRAWAHGAVRGPVPARRAARPRHLRRDARDGGALVGPDGPPRGGPRGDRTRRCRPRDARAGDVPHLAPVPGRRLALLHLPRARRRRAPSWSSGRRSSRPPATRSWRRGGRSPTTTRSAATTRRGCRRRWARSGVEALRALKERLDPAGILNPGKLIPARRRQS